MTGIELSQKLRQGDRVYGTLVTSTSPRMIPLLAGMPVDFVFIDTEHIPIDRHDLAYMCYAFDASGLAPIVRIPTPDPYVAGQVVDNGAVAVVAPYVETVEQVRTLVGAVKKRPLKGRKLAQEIEGSVPFEPELSAYVQKHNAGLSVIVNIESVPAIEVLDEILAVGDEGFQQKCLKFFEDLKKQKKTLIFVSHSKELVESICDRVVEISF